MDERSLEKISRKRERGYIWLERELKIELGISTAVIAVFFFILFYFQVPVGVWAALFCALELLNGIWCFLRYRREYRNYLSILEYLEEFEQGNYGYQKSREGLDTGIRAQLTEQLERMGQALGTMKGRLVEEKENTKSIVTDIAHQLKTPVSALRLSYELMEDEGLSEEERQEFLRRGGSEVHKLSYLLDTLMNLSKLEADMIHLNPKPGSIRDTLVQAVNGVYMKAEEKGIEIEMQEFPDLELVHDTRWTAEAVSNVLDNAVKYSPSGTTVQIRVEPRVSYVFIEVEDKGIGIAKSEYPHIFQRFYRGKNPEVAGQEGSGVGLYLVRKILEEQGGSVRACQGRHGGTVIQMMLPQEYKSGQVQ